MNSCLVWTIWILCRENRMSRSDHPTPCMCKVLASYIFTMILFNTHTLPT